MRCYVENKMNVCLLEQFTYILLIIWNVNEHNKRIC